MGGFRGAGGRFHPATTRVFMGSEIPERGVLVRDYPLIRNYLARFLANLFFLFRGMNWGKGDSVKM